MAKNVTAKTRYGKYVGKENVHGVIEFKGIPYAKTPKRWQEAELPDPSDDVFEAFEFAPMCVQPYWPEECREGDPQTEDCLKLNICTANVDKKGKPVMVFIHGGAYISGYAGFEGYYGDQLVSDNPDIVFVNFTYRLGLFGNMNFSSIDPAGKYKGSVNLTTKDQILALQWIKENVAAFGGDPDNILVFGQSAGSYSIVTLMTISETKGLFQKAICESGVFDDNSINDMSRSEEMGKWFIQQAGIQSIEELDALDIDRLRELDEELFWEFPLAYSPVRDGDLIPLDTYGAFLEGAGRDVQLMIGNTEGDGERLVSDDPEEHKRRAIQTVHPQVLTEETLEQFAANDPDRPRILAYQEAVTDVRYRLPATMLAECQSQYNDVYMYLWQWHANGYVTRAPHCIELPFVMNKLGVDLCLFMEHGRVQGDDAPKALQKAAQAAWTNFARYGTPNGPGVDITWEKFDTQKRATMIINETWHIKYDLRKKDRELLMPLYPEIRSHT